MIRQVCRAFRPGMYMLAATMLASAAAASGPLSMRHGPVPGGASADEPVASPPVVTAPVADVAPTIPEVEAETATSATASAASASESALVLESERPLVRAAWEDLPLGRGVEAPVGGSVPPARAGITSHWMVRTGLALAAVIALIFMSKWTFQWLSGRAGGVGSQLRAAGRSPSGVLEVLARYPIARGQTLALLKLDRRILLVAQTAAGFQTLSEITHPDEVASILLKTRDDEGESMAARFAALLKDLERDPGSAPTSASAPAGDAKAATGPARDEYVPSNGRGADRMQVLRGGR